MHNLRIVRESLHEFFGDLSYIHGTKETDSRAFLAGEKRALVLRVSRGLAVTEGYFEFSKDGKRESLSLVFDSLCGSDDVYLCSLAEMGVGLYFGRIRLVTVFGEFFGVKEGRRVRFVRDPFVNDTLQISVSRFAFPTPDSYLGGTIYHIFVDRFAKGSRPISPKTGAKMVENWEEGVPEYPELPGAYLENNTFYGGTLYGVAERLDYLASLGVSLIYLSPIFEAYSNHKYDTANYMKVDSMFGGEEALRFLIDEAKKRDIGILLDGVFNHTGSDSIYFNKRGIYPSVGAYQSADSPFYSWYDFQNHPNEYTCWWNIPILPRIHPDREECRSYFLENDGVIQKYAKMGIAGFRLDVADELSDDFIAGIKRVLCETNPKSLLYGEVWEDASNKVAYGVRKQYYLGKELDGVMNYPLRKALLSYVLSKDPSELFYVFEEVYPNTPKRILDAQMNLLGTHDTERILTALAGEHREGVTNAELRVKHMSEEERALGKARLKMLYTVLATLPGLPMIYYGDEVGLEGYSDPFNRMPYPYGKEDGELLSHYMKIGAIRKTNAVYKRGDFSLISLTNSHLIFERKANASVYLTVLNQDSKPMEISISEHSLDVLSDKKGKEFTIHPNSATIIKTKKEFNLCINEG